MLIVAAKKKQKLSDFFQQMPSNFASNQWKRIFTVSVPFSERQVAPTEVLCYHLQAVRYLLVTRKYLEEAPVKIQIQGPVKILDFFIFHFWQLFLSGLKEDNFSSDFVMKLIPDSSELLMESLQCKM